MSTITTYAYARIEAGLPMPGVFEVSQRASLGRIIEDLLLLATLSLEGEWESRIGSIPLR